MQDGIGLYMGYMGYIEILPQSWGIKTKNKMETGTAFVYILKCVYICVYIYVQFGKQLGSRTHIASSTAADPAYHYFGLTNAPLNPKP